MNENTIVWLTMIAAAVFLAYRLFAKKNPGKCGCGCSGCARGKTIKIDSAPISACAHCASNKSR